MRRTLITGANRGLGLAFVRESLARGDRVYATCRRPGEAHALQELTAKNPDELTIVRLDVTDEGTIEATAKAVQAWEVGLDLLINNAGVNPPGESPGSLDAATMLHTFHANALGPMMVVQHHLDLLRAGRDAKIVSLSSQLASLTWKSRGGSYAYCSGKAALNLPARALAFDLSPDGIIAVAIHPGWIRTDSEGRGLPLPQPNRSKGSSTSSTL
jgi:NAD(P)-dependent dehydrogenase (short-subunit alcohol dehydrogenase family)